MLVSFNQQDMLPLAYQLFNQIIPHRCKLTDFNCVIDISMLYIHNFVTNMGEIYKYWLDSVW